MLDKIVKVDMDGVIRDIFTPMCRIYNERYGTNVLPCDITDYDVNKSFPKVMEVDNRNAADFFFIDHGREVFLESKPYDSAQETLSSLMLCGWKVVITTWQFTNRNKRYTLDFLERNGIIYDDICFTRDKWLVQGGWLIDDNPEFILDDRDTSRKIMVNMPYNQTVMYDGIRKDNLFDAARYIIQTELSKQDNF